MIGTKKKSELSTILDDLRSEDPKKRLNAVLDIKDVAATLGPARVRAQLIGFLAQFIDDQENIVLELLSQLEGFTSLVGGSQNQKCLLPLLISFCKTDDKKIAFKACQHIQKVLTNCKEQIVETIKKLMKTEMNVAKQCGIKLITVFLPFLESSEPTLLDQYTALHSCDNPQLKIMASKYLIDISRNLKSKEEISKILEVIYSEGDELSKIYGLPALIDHYEVNSNFCLTKFKNLSVINSWRINIKICQIAETAVTKVTKPHFKLIFEPILLKFMSSNEPELRAASCQTISSICKHLTDEDQKSKLLPLLKKLVVDPVQFVKVQLSKNIVSLCGIVSQDLMNDSILPIIFTFLKDPNSEITLGIIKSFQYIVSKLTKQVFEEKVIKQVLLQLNTDNWRIKCQIIDILKRFLVSQTYLSESVIRVFIGLTDDRIDAVRLKANQLIIEIINKNTKEWCEQNIIPKLFSTKENTSYIKKQNLLEIIEKTSPNVSEKALKDIYQGAIVNCLNDKVPNVKLKSLNVLKSYAKLTNPMIEKQLEKLREDKDIQIKEAVKKLRA